MNRRQLLARLAFLFRSRLTRTARFTALPDIYFLNCIILIQNHYADLLYVCLLRKEKVSCAVIV